MPEAAPDIEINHLKSFEPLSTLSDSHLKEVAPHTKTLQFEQGKMLFKRAQPSKYYYYLVDGSIDILNSKYQVTAITAHEERALQPLDNNDPYENSAVTTSNVTILRVSKDRLDLVLTWNQAGNYLVEEVDEDDGSTLDSDWMSCLLGSSLFQQIPPANLQQLFVKFNEINVSANTNIINEGDPGNDFFVIKTGKAEVYRGKDANKVKLATLGPGQYFGEEALIGDTVRNASVVMKVSGVLMKLVKEDFKNLLEQPVITLISYKEFAELKNSDDPVHILDVRLPVEIPPNERQDRMIVPLPDLRNRLNALDKNAIYVLYPDGGRRATLGAYLLNEAGFRAVVLKDDI